MRVLPPLNAMRAFECVARHGSCVRAADELHVTAAAVSQQIRLLEDNIGIRLFRRDRRRLVLTPAGEACLPAVADGFERLRSAVRLLRRVGTSQRLVISVAPSFAAKWLVPRLPRFREAYPDIDLWISTAMALVDLREGNFDAAIRFGRGAYIGLQAEKISAESVFPVCSPQVLKDKPLKDPADLRHHTLLHHDSLVDDSSYPDWQIWLRAAGVSDVDTTRGHHFDTMGLLIEAAVGGNGVALAQGRIAEEDLRAGRLVRPLADSLALDFAYYLTFLPNQPAGNAVSVFADWIKKEAKRHRG